MIQIYIHRIYEDHPPQGHRVLVDRLWPRGISKDRAALDDWWKDLTPSTELRKWFGHKEERFHEFRINYLLELEKHQSLAKTYIEKIPNKSLILLYGAKSPTCNHALILQDFLKNMY